jgi:hypothetical protein
MANEKEDTPEVASIKSRIESWLDAHNNKIELDLTGDDIDAQQYVGMGFSDEDAASGDTLDKIRSRFEYIALNHLPVPGIQEIASNWDIYPQTPLSSFSEGVTFDKYDANTQSLYLTVNTRFFAIYGSKHLTGPRMACAPSPPGTYLQVRRDIEGIIRLRVKYGCN